VHSLVRAVAIRLVPALVVSLATVPVIAQAGQTPSPQPPPNIAVSAVGETYVVPDRAMLSVAVESQGETAAKAGADNAAKQTRVIDAAKAAGIAAAQVRTSGYNVFPEYAQAPGKGPRVTGYRANNTVQIEVRNLEAVGKVIDAVLAAGATNIGAVNLYASNTDAARREALQKAVAKARGEAEAAATAAGGSLGALVDLAVEPWGPPQPLARQVMMAADAVRMAVPTPIESGEMLIQAVVRARWQFVPAQR
jgi:uncharacterized protein